MRKNLRHYDFCASRGETLIEVVVALTIMMIVLTPSMIVNVQGLRGIQAARDYAIAGNLAADGVEAVRYLIEKNKIYHMFEEDRDECWNLKEDGSDCTETNHKIAAGTYKVELNDPLDPGAIHIIGPVAATLNLADGADADFLLKIDPITKFYTHACNSGSCPVSPYYRSVTIAYEDDPINIIMRVTSKVEWFSSRGTSHITNEDYFYKN